MRILQFIPDGIPTFRPDVTVLWGKYLPRYGVCCDISTIKNSEEQSEVWSGGGLYLYYPLRFFPKKLGWFLHDCGVLWRTRRSDHDAVQVRDRSFVAVFAYFVAKFRKIPFFYWMSFPMEEARIQLARQIDPKKEFARWLYNLIRGRLGSFILYRYILPRANHIFVQSDRMKDDLIAKGISEKQMTAVPMGIDPDRFPHLQASTSVGKKDKRIVAYLGVCSKSRKTDFLFEVVAKILPLCPNILLYVIGDAPVYQERIWLRKRMEELALTEHVIITGWLPERKAQEFLSLAEVALALMAPDPFLLSATPTKLVEYLAMGKAVVANNHPDQSRVIEESGAGICTSFDPQHFADAVVRLLLNDQLRKEKSSAGRPFVLAHRSYPAIAERVASVYDQLVRDFHNRVEKA